MSHDKERKQPVATTTMNEPSPPSAKRPEPEPEPTEAEKAMDAFARLIFGDK